MFLQTQWLYFLKELLTVENTEAAGPDANITDKKGYIKQQCPFTSCISRINNTQIHDTQYVDAAMSMYSLIAYCDNYSNSSGIWGIIVEMSCL